MMTTRPGRLAASWLAAGAVAAGCSAGPRELADLGPPDPVASRAALVAALDAWKAGRRESGVLLGSGPAIGVVDATRVDRPLRAYEILGPLMASEKARPFAVRLALDAPPEDVAARYLVLGRDPLWVFRQEDFERMLHWEHRMDPEPKAEPGPEPTPPAAP